jgi:hypothetical protein
MFVLKYVMHVLTSVRSMRNMEWIIAENALKPADVVLKNAGLWPELMHNV